MCGYAVKAANDAESVSGLSTIVSCGFILDTHSRHTNTDGTIPDVTYGLFKQQLEGTLFSGSMNAVLCDFWYVAP